MRYSWRVSSPSQPPASSTTNNLCIKHVPILKEFRIIHTHTTIHPAIHTDRPFLKGKSKARHKSDPYSFFALPIITACLDSSWAFISSCVSRRNTLYESIIKRSTTTRIKLAQSQDTIKFFHEQSLVIHCCVCTEGQSSTSTIKQT